MFHHGEIEVTDWDTQTVKDIGDKGVKKSVFRLWILCKYIHRHTEMDCHDREEQGEDLQIGNTLDNHGRNDGELLDDSQKEEQLK